MSAILPGLQRVLGGMSSRRWASVRLIGMLVALAALLVVVLSPLPHADVAHAQTDTTLPALDGTPYIDANVVVITYDEALDEDSIPGNDAYTVTINGSEVEIDEARIDGRVVEVLILAIVYEGQTVLLSYTKGTNPVRDTEGNDAADLDEVTVENRGLPRPSPPEQTGTPYVDGKPTGHHLRRGS